MFFGSKFLDFNFLCDFNFFFFFGGGGGGGGMEIFVYIMVNG